LTFTTLSSLAINTAGTGYTVGNTVAIQGGLNGTATVVSISGSGSTGPVTGLLLGNGGVGYTNGATGVQTTGGTGTGLTVNLTTFSNDPAFSNADWVMQTILAPPFAWRWNRVTASPTAPTFVTNPGVSDYSVALPNFGWLEKAAAYDPNNGYFCFELQSELLKSIDTLQNQPTRISTQLDDGSGNITFRVFPAPDKIYNIVVEYQKSAPQFTSLSQTWAPVPDYMSNVYNSGFDAKSYEYVNDPRYPSALQMFFTSLSGVSQGLEAAEKNIWLGDRLASIRQTMAAQQGRG